MNVALALTLARDAILESTVIELEHRLRIRQHEQYLRSRLKAAARWRPRKQSRCPTNMQVPENTAAVSEGISNVNGDQQYEEPLGLNTHETGHQKSSTNPDENDSTDVTLEEDARNLFYTRIFISLSLFLVFWMVCGSICYCLIQYGSIIQAGSAVFMKTEKWSFGSAAYFCETFCCVHMEGTLIFL